MKNSSKAFTLIELLVVVLIIGILAAVALPQYQKSVVKARFAEAKAHLHTLAQAVKACKFEEGKTCETVGELDIQIGEDNTYMFQTPYFGYGLMHTTRGFLGAAYKREPVCVCYFLEEDRMALAPVSNYYCATESDEQTLDYGKLLGLPEDSNCECC